MYVLASTGGGPRPRKFAGVPLLHLLHFQIRYVFFNNLRGLICSDWVAALLLRFAALENKPGIRGLGKAGTRIGSFGGALMALMA